MSIRKSWILGAASAAGLFAQQGSLGGPVSGYVFDSQAQSLRIVRGIPGASVIGDGVDLGAGVTSAWVAPRQDAALLVSAEGVARLVRLDGATVADRPVEGMLTPDRAVFSPSGTALALVTAGSVQVVKGLPDAPSIAGTVQLPGADRAPLTAAMAADRKLVRPGGGTLAVSDDGAYLLYESAGSVQLLPVAGSSRKLTDAVPNALLAFAPGGHDAAVIDGHTVALFQDVAGASTVRNLPGIAGGKGAGFSSDGKTLFVAAPAVIAMNVATGDVSEIACNCQPSGLIRMGNSFRLNELGTEPLWLLDASAEPKVMFVPARSAM
jgi:hypothetical protein